MSASMVATVVDTKELWQTVAAAFVAGIGITFAFSLAVLGAARFADASRDGRRAVALLFAGVAAAGLLATAAGIAVGIIVMTSG